MFSSPRELEESFRAVAQFGKDLPAGTEMYFDLPTASKLLALADENGFAVVRIEGLRNVTGGVEPQMDWIFAWPRWQRSEPWQDYRKSCNIHAAIFLEQANQNAIDLATVLVDSEVEATERHE